MPSLCAVLAWLLNQIDDSELISCTLCEQANCFFEEAPARKKNATEARRH